MFNGEFFSNKDDYYYDTDGPRHKKTEWEIKEEEKKEKLEWINKTIEEKGNKIKMIDKNLNALFDNIADDKKEDSRQIIGNPNTPTLKLEKVQSVQKIKEKPWEEDAFSTFMEQIIETAEETNFESLQDGEYNAKLLEIALKSSKEGHKMIQYSFEIKKAIGATVKEYKTEFLPKEIFDQESLKMLNDENVKQEKLKNIKIRTQILFGELINIIMASREDKEKEKVNSEVFEIFMFWKNTGQDQNMTATIHNEVVGTLSIKTIKNTKDPDKEYTRKKFRIE